MTDYIEFDEKAKTATLHYNGAEITIPSGALKLLRAFVTPDESQYKKVRAGSHAFSNCVECGHLLCVPGGTR
jgi:hypothetical protein